VTKAFNLAWLTSGVTAKRVDELAKSLEVGLHSPGVCPMCLLLVATELEHEDGRPAAGRITMIAPTLWAEGLDRPVRDALKRKVRAGIADATDALLDLDERGFRSGIFRAVVRRLAVELKESAQRAYLASLN
jgi:hypothetical protein